MTVMEAIKVPTAADLVVRAEALMPVLRERAAQCEAENKVPDATIRD